MPALNNTQLSLLRTKPQTSNWYLYPVIPNPIFKAQVNDVAITVGAVVITFDNVTLGAWTDIVAGMTLWVGSAAGLYDVARIRIRGATASTITVAENADVVWADDLYLTVIKQWLPWGVRPRIVSGTVYKDYNIAYTDQTDKWPPVSMMGDPAIKFFDTNPTNVYFDGAESYAVAQGATISTHAWAFDDGGTSAVATPGNHGYTATGDYWVSHTVTDSNSKTHTTRRPVCVINRNSAYVNFRCDSMSGGIDAGWVAKFTVFGNAPLSAFPERAPIFFFSDDNFGSNAGSQGFPLGRENVLMFGYIQEDSVTKNPETGDITFDVAGIARAMERISMYPATTQDKTTPSAWTEAKNLNIFRSFVFLLKFHTTVMDVADVFLYNDTTPIRVTNFPEDNLWNMFAQFAKGARMMRVGATRTGRVVLGRDPNLVAIASRGTIPVVMQLAQGDWVGQVTMPEQPYPLCAYLCLGGLTYDGTPAHESNPLFGMSPGRPNKEFGDSREIHFLQLLSQTEVNTLAGLALGQINNAFGDVVVEMAGNWTRAFDPALQEYVQAPSSGWVSKRGTLLTNQFLIVRKVELKFNWASGYVNSSLTCEVYSYPDIGTNGDCFTTDAPLPPTTPPIVIVPPLPPNPTGTGTTSFLSGIWTMYATGDIYRLTYVTPSGGNAVSKPAWKTAFVATRTPFDTLPGVGALVNVISLGSDIRVHHSTDDALTYGTSVLASPFSTLPHSRLDKAFSNVQCVFITLAMDRTPIVAGIQNRGIYDNTSVKADYTGATGDLKLLFTLDGGNSWNALILGYVGLLWATQLVGLQYPGNAVNIQSQNDADIVGGGDGNIATWDALFNTVGGPFYVDTGAGGGVTVVGGASSGGASQFPLGYWILDRANIAAVALMKTPTIDLALGIYDSGQYAYAIVSGWQVSKNLDIDLGGGITVHYVLNPCVPDPSVSVPFLWPGDWNYTNSYAQIYKVDMIGHSAVSKSFGVAGYSGAAVDSLIVAEVNRANPDQIYLMSRKYWFCKYTFSTNTATSPVDLGVALGATAINIFCTSQGTVLIGCTNGHVKRSTNGGSTWTDINLGLGAMGTFYATEYHGTVGGSVGAIVVPVDNTQKYAYSLDDGATWYVTQALTVNSTVLSNFAR